MTSRNGWMLAAMLSAAATSPTLAQDTAPATASWQLSVTPYLWATALKGDARVGRTKADVDASFSDILDNLNGALMLSVEARRGRFGLLSDAPDGRGRRALGRPDRRRAYRLDRR